VADARDILGAGAEFQCHHRFRDHFRRVRSDDVNAEGRDRSWRRRESSRNPRSRPGQGAAVVRERHLADAVGHAFGLQVAARLAHPGGFPERVDHPRYGVQIDLAAWPAMRSATITPSSMPLCASIGPRTTSPTAYTLAAGAAMFIHLDQAALVDLQPHRIGAEVMRIGHAPDRYHQLVAIERLLAFGGFVLLPSRRACRGSPCRFSRRADLQPLLLDEHFHASFATAASAALENLGKASRTVTFAPSAATRCPVPVRSRLAPIDAELVRYGVERKCADVVTNGLVVHFQAGKWRAVEPVARMTWFAFHGLGGPAVSALRPCISQHAAANLPWPFNQVILFFLNSISMPPVSWDTILSLRACILADIYFRSSHRNSVIAELVGHALVVFEDSSSALDGMQRH